MIKSYLLAPGPTPVPPARAALPRFYFDLARERKGVAERSTAWTPAISLIQGLRVSLGRGVGATEAVLADGLPAR